jgi:hypothetical protein
MKRFLIADPETFHLRRRILQTAGIPYRQVGDELELEQDLEKLPESKQLLVRAALQCHLDWHALAGLTAKEKVAIGVAAMDVDSYRARRPVTC